MKFGNEVWQEVKAEFTVHLHRQQFTSSQVWALDFLQRCSDVEATYVMTTMWHIWDARNRIREGENLMHPHAPAMKIKAYIDMILQHLYKTGTDQRCETKISSIKWSPPPVGIVSVNVDATIFSASNRMGSGVVIRDHNGACLATCSEHFEGITSPELAEAMAARQALCFAKSEGFEKVIVQSDCLLVVQRVNSSTTDRSINGPVMKSSRS
jgi:hypothetical protein